MDWGKIKNTLQAIGYEGDKWMQIEWAIPGKADIVESYRHNLKFLRELFPGK